MSRTLGVVVFIVGIVALGWWGSANNARYIEQHLTGEVAKVTGMATHEVSAIVSGRDIALVGSVDSEAEGNALAAAADEIHGRRAVRTDFNIIPRATPYFLGATRAADGEMTLTGTMPTRAESNRLADLTDVDGLAALDIASGAPEGWTAIVEGSLGALSQLETGTLEITDTAISLIGTASDDATAASVEAALAAIPGVGQIASEVDVPLPLRSPYTFTATGNADGVTGLTGYAPSEAAVAALADAVDPRLANALSVAAGAPDGWGDAVGTGYQALSELNFGKLSISDTDISLTGQAPDEETRSAIGNALAGLSGYTATTEISVEPKIVPSDLSIRFDRVRGLLVSGIAPEDVSAATVAQQLSAPSVTGDFNGPAATTSSTSVLSALDSLQGYLGEFENLTLTAQGEQVTIEGELLQEADLEQIHDRLVDAGFFDTVTLALAQRRFNAGDTRVNNLTGKLERYSGSFWIPVVEVSTASAKDCTEATNRELDEGRILFLTGSATLDAASRATISSIAAVLQTCFADNPGLAVEIGGHTDSSGSDGTNMRLSLSRATAVVEALVARGIAPDRLVAQGYGETQPIADNATEEGRRANRRTSILWTE